MSEVSRRYVIGLGANLGDRLLTLRSAVTELGRRGTLRAVSAVYETAPLGPPQPDYLNAAVSLESVLNPRQLLDELLAIERAHGRQRSERWGPRTLDLDLLWAAELVVDEPGLSVPHPGLASRAFALIPLLDVAPDARDPRSGVAYIEQLRALDVAEVRRLEASGGWGEPSEPNDVAGLQAERNSSAV